MDKDELRRVIAAVLIVYIGVASVAAIELIFMPPLYEFKTGVTHPQEIGDLLKNGTVVLLFTHNDCSACMNAMRKMADLQAQYSGINVTFVTFNIYENTTTSLKMFENYKIDFAPQVFVIRSDGAVAKITGEFADISPAKNAIEDAQNWQQSHST